MTIAGTGDERKLFAVVHHLEARIADPFLAAHRFEVFLPALPIRRIGEHEVEFLRRESVVRERGPFRAADDVIGAFALALQQHVRLADGVGFGIDLLPVEQAPDFLFAFCRNRRERFLRDCQHPARTAGAVVKQVGASLDLILDRQEHEVCHQANGVSRRPVFARFLVVLFIELADQFLKDRAHRMVVDAGGGQIDLGVEKLVYQRTERVGFRERCELVAEFEVVENVLNVGREPVQIVLKVGEELLLAATGFEIAQREF